MTIEDDIVSFVQKDVLKLNNIMMVDAQNRALRDRRCRRLCNCTVVTACFCYGDIACLVKCVPHVKSIDVSEGVNFLFHISV